MTKSMKNDGWIQLTSEQKQDKMRIMVSMWNENYPVSEIAKKAEITTDRASMIANQLRKKGVMLVRKSGRGSNFLTEEFIAELKALAKS